MQNKTFLVLNGPNLGFIGKRQPEIYGSDTMEDLPKMVEGLMGGRASDLQLEFFQSNSEGELIDRLEKAHFDKIAGVAFNAGAYTHTSLAIADCIAWIDVPVVEVHISNIWGRFDQPIRQQSYMGKNCIGVIAGFGVLGYALAVQSLYEHGLKL
ncbi:MAG: type II 3-dehydroquinate dehydratase [Desulfovibrio sp.]